jgi:hypothetical protein
VEYVEYGWETASKHCNKLEVLENWSLLDV